MMRLFPLTAFCMALFSLNSVLCRMALITYGMGAIRYTVVRGLSAAVMLALLCALHVIRARDGGGVWRQAWQQSSWPGAAFLFLYMLGFSLGYLGMSSAAGALILICAVQVSMIGWGIFQGFRPGKVQVAGLVLALVGVAILVSPGVSAPSLRGTLFMAGAGLAWGAYCLCGRKVHSASLASVGNFLRAAAMGLAACVAATWEQSASLPAVACAVMAGTLASALAYTLWYALMPRYSLMGASVIQLSVPLFAAVLAWPLLDEQISLRLLVCTLFILGGIFLVLRVNKPSFPKNPAR